MDETTDVKPVKIYDISGDKPVAGTIHPDEVQDALTSGRFSLPKGKKIDAVDPNGDLVSLEPHEAPAAFQSGYQYATPQMVNDVKYGSIKEQAKGALEAAARSATFGQSTRVEKDLLGVKPEDISGREEALSGPLKFGAETAGLMGSALIPGGEGAILEKLGAAGVKALDLGGAGALSKIGSAAVKGAIETGVYQGGNEAHKMILGDPNQSVETAVANIGMSGLLGGAMGGAIGTVSPLWKATTGDKLGGWLEAIQRRTNGEAVELRPDIKQALSDTGGLEIAPEIRSGMSEVPDLANKFNMLQESKTMPGQELQKSVDEFYKSSGEHIVDSLGRDAEKIASTGEISNFDAGSKVQDDLVSQIKDTVEPITKQFEKIKDTFSKIPLTQADDHVADKLANLAEKEGWLKSPSSPEAKVFNDVIKEIPLQETLEDLRKFQSNIWSRARENPSLYGAVGKISNILEETEMAAMERAAGMKGEQHLADLALAKAQYRTAKGTIEALNDRLHVGKYGGPATFTRALEEMKPEEVLSRLSRPNDAGLIELLQKEFPSIAQNIREHQLSKLLGNAAMKAKEGHAINTKTFFNAYDKMTPEMRDFVVGKEAQRKIDGVRTLIDAIPKYKSSGTAGNLDSLWSKLPGGAAALVAMITGHNPAVGFMLGQTARWASRDAPDAISLAMLKFLGKSGPVEPEAFKSMVDFIHQTTKGQNITSKAISGLFKSGPIALPRHLVPDLSSREKLDKRVKEMGENPEALADVGGKSTYYLDNHGVAFGETAGRVVSYLNSIRPKVEKTSPLDPELKPNKPAMAEYHKALDIAEQPLLVLQDIKDGTLRPQDVQHLQHMYPNLYQKIATSVHEEIMNHASEEGKVPYKMRLGLSLFLNEPMDSSISQPQIMASQATFQQAPTPQQGQQMPPKMGGGKLNALGKMTDLYQTSQQARVKDKAMA
jgi:hypothetical protein